MREMTIFAFLIAMLSTAIALPEQAAEDTLYRFHEESEMVIYGSANITRWTMDVTEIDGEVRVIEGETGAFRFENLRIQVPVEGITADQSGQERDAHQALRRDAYPVIYFTAYGTEVGEGNASFEVHSEGRLSIAGVQRDVVVEAEGQRLDDERIRVEGAKELLLSDFGIDPPTAFLGLLRVRDEVRVEFDVVLVPEA